MDNIYYHQFIIDNIINIGGIFVGTCVYKLLFKIYTPDTVLVCILSHDNFNRLKNNLKNIIFSIYEPVVINNEMNNTYIRYYPCYIKFFYSESDYIILVINIILHKKKITIRFKYIKDAY
jgi:hypothetical protein